MGGYTTKTTFYGGQCICDIGADAAHFQKPCNYASCSICIAISEGFETLGFGSTGYDGIYGRGMYTHFNPFMAHRFTVEETSNGYHAIIACSVIFPLPPSKVDKKNIVVRDEPPCRQLPYHNSGLCCRRRTRPEESIAIR